MVRPSGRGGDADLGPVTDRTGRVEGCLVTASSRGVRGRHSISDISVTPTPLAPGFHHGIGEAGSSTQPPVVPFRSRPPLHQSHTPVPYEPYGSAHPPSHHTNTVYDPYLQAPTIVRPRIPYLSAFQEPILYDGSQERQIGDSSCSTHGYFHTDYGVSSSDHYVPGPADRVPEGSRNKRPDVVRDVSAPTQKRKKVKPSDWEQTKATEGGPVDSELIPSYGGHVAGRIWCGQDRGFNALELHAVATSRQTSQSHRERAACYLQYILGSSLFSDKSGNIVPARLWPLLRDNLGQASRADAKEFAGCWSLLVLFRARIYLYFSMFAPPFRHAPEGCKPTCRCFHRSAIRVRVNCWIFT
ncbi:hypothetical protein M9H77_14427 [Catharanthus roseus]|uniref:Uncharacterized protein n=1 Tax=Catharanthus roseus TaxID=4058 RepID=A0ACC0BN53_CATRO|nr:hypothetical protein M9H77_14427 [Catharanthus roseus]